MTACIFKGIIWYNKMWSSLLLWSMKIHVIKDKNPFLIHVNYVIVVLCHMYINNKTTLLINIIIYSDSSSEETPIHRKTFGIFFIRNLLEDSWFSRFISISDICCLQQRVLHWLQLCFGLRYLCECPPVMDYVIQQLSSAGLRLQTKHSRCFLAHYCFFFICPPDFNLLNFLSVIKEQKYKR